MRSEISRRLERLAQRRGPHAPKVVTVGGRRLETTPIEEFELRLPVEAGEVVSVGVESVASASERGSALLEVRALAPTGARLTMPRWPQRSARVGEYQYLESGGSDEDIALTVFDVTVPDQASELVLVGHRWKARVETVIVGAPVVNKSSDTSWVFETVTGAKLQHSAAYLDRQLDIPEDASAVEIRIEHVARQEPSSGPVAIAALNSRGDELPPIPALQQHPDLGGVVLLRGEVDEHKTTLTSFPVPRGANRIRLRGVEWGPKTAFISGEPSLVAIHDRSRSIEDFVAAVPRDEQLVIIDTTAPPMGHATLGLRPNNLSHAYARAGRWVVFLPFSSLQEFAHDIGERLFQVPRSEIDELWDAVRTHRRGLRDVYICSSFPSMQALAAANDARRLGWTVVYEVRDDMEEFNRVGYSKWYSPILEQQMLRTADRVVSVSRALDEKMMTMHPGIGPHVVIPNGVRATTIRSGEPLRTREAADERRSSAVVGYVGHLTPSWFDWPMLLRVAARLPDVRFEIVGHGMPDTIQLPANVHYLGAKTHDELVDVVRTWKAGLIPFRDIPLTRSVDPNKIYEYFAWGLRCVTVDMGAVSAYPWTKVYDDDDSFEAHLRWALDTPVGDADLSELEDFLSRVDWDSRATEMLSFIAEGARR